MNVCSDTRGMSVAVAANKAYIFFKRLKAKKVIT